jgi:hypothetical protein
MTDLKIPFCKLYERRSKSTGLTYLTGKLGDMRVLMFRDKDVPDEELYGADGRWQVYVTGGDQGYQQRLAGRHQQELALRPVRPNRWSDK